MSAKVIVGMSGGVDSSVSAWLLQQQGYAVEGFFMQNWQHEATHEANCPATTDLMDVMKVCDQLNIPLHADNFSAQYRQRVFEHFVQEYAKGRTPNPDILCNSEIKFDVLLQHVKNLGANYLATGHYAKCLRFSSTTSQLHQAKDSNKDQTYFLYNLTQQQLNHSLFPLANWHKKEVRQQARKLALATHNKKDSTGICFIGEREFRQFMRHYLPSQPGDIIDENGKVIGRHHGAAYYTIGQRKQLGIGGIKGGSDQPWYVASKDAQNNTLVAVQGDGHPLLRYHKLIATELNWINQPPRQGSTYQARIRHRQPLQTVNIAQVDAHSLSVEFRQTQFAIAAGQSIVLYEGSRCLGGGVIDIAIH